MPSNQMSIQEIAPIYGMNTVDDARTLRPGQCVRLLNMFPGNPPIPRNGCPGIYKNFLAAGDSFVPPILIFSDVATAKSRAIVWILSGGRYYLATTDADGNGEIISNGVAEITNPIFSMAAQHECVYCFINNNLTSWNSDTKALGPKVYESDLIVRDMCISEAAQIDALSQTASGGPFSNGKHMSYAFQFVRRNDAAAFESGATPTGMIIPYGIASASKPKRIDTFLPGSCVGIENSTYRKPISIASGTSKVTIDISSATADAAIAIGIAQGATHMRVSRTLEFDSLVLANAATHFFHFDIPLGIGATSFDDTTLAVDEDNQLLTGYTTIPESAYGKFHLNRLFVINEDGMVYFSVAPGGDGAYNGLNVQEYPQAWASIFSPTTFFIDCDSNDGVKASGIEVLGNDIYFIKKSKIFALFNGDPLNATKTLVSENIGCPFPHTIKKIDLPTKGTCIFFLSNRGPAIIRQGGDVSLLEEFKIAELWPDFNKDLFAQLDLNPDDIINSCSSAWYNNTVWIFYQTLVGSKKIFGYYINPSDKNIQGSLEVELATDSIFGNIVGVDVSNLKAYLFGSTLEYLVVTEFLKRSTWEDLSTPEVYFASSITEDTTGTIDDGSETVEG